MDRKINQLLNRHIREQVDPLVHFEEITNYRLYGDCRGRGYVAVKGAEAAVEVSVPEQPAPVDANQAY